ncbi:hypothetical protein [Paraburkholderia sp. UCT2]|uniref:hypothetical protein n=1 Tax=Paraburkholderia sp. UCT2 TaxID=2615208 RepID=UPI001656379C|nr:hypothetical protein [Paraburkholderia sp. UCT2]
MSEEPDPLRQGHLIDGPVRPRKFLHYCFTVYFRLRAVHLQCVCGNPFNTTFACPKEMQKPASFARKASEYGDEPAGVGLQPEAGHEHTWRCRDDEGHEDG